MSFALVLILCVSGLLFGHRVQSRPIVWIAKPLASTVFVAAALARGALETAYGKAVLVALVLGWLGDVLLIPKSKGPFLAGVVAFLFGHLAFVAAFLVRGVDPVPAALMGAALLLPALLVWRKISPGLDPKLKAPVGAYALMLVTMASTAIGTAWSKPSWPIALAAVAFFLSDISVARERFLVSSFSNKVWGLPLYYGAQLVFALTVAQAP